jgi:hypothetical protein
LAPKLSWPWTRTLTAADFQVVFADDESRFCGMDFYLFGALDFAVDLVGGFGC